MGLKTEPHTGLVAANSTLQRIPYAKGRRYSLWKHRTCTIPCADSTVSACRAAGGGELIDAVCVRVAAHPVIHTAWGL